MIKTFLILLIMFLLIRFNGYSERSLICDNDEETLSKGRSFLKTKKVAFCGLIRDGEERLSHIIPQVEDIGGYFKDWIVLAVENDSKDNTRGKLLEWSNKNNKVFILGCDGINLSECKLNMKATTDHSANDYRIKKMAYLRNIYLDELRKEKYNDIDYVIVWDFDLIGVIDKNGLLETGYELSMNSNIKGICANGIIKHDILPFITKETVKKELGIPLYFYYDTYAYRNLDDTTNLLRNKGMYDFVYSNPDKCGFDKEEKTKKVKSCFGGFTIYKKDAVKTLKYGTYLDNNGTPICEHQYLNEGIDGIYHNKGFLYLISQN
jgi:hypothetical protein